MCDDGCDHHHGVRPAPSEDEDAGAWTFVKRSKKRRKITRAPRAVRCAAAPSGARDDDDAAESDAALTERVQRCCNELQSSPLYGWVKRSALLALAESASGPGGAGSNDAAAASAAVAAAAPSAADDTVDIIAYGVGRFIETDAALLQLACALQLRRDVDAGCVRGRLQLFEPLLSDVERRSARALGFELIERNELGWRPISQCPSDASASSPPRRTLFFMPHCPKWLYHNVLASNWSPPSLRRLVVLGNSFSVYGEHDLVWDDDAEGLCAATIERACAALVERAQPKWPSDGSALECRLRTAFSDARCASSRHFLAFSPSLALPEPLAAHRARCSPRPDSSRAPLSDRTSLASTRLRSMPALPSAQRPSSTCLPNEVR